MINSDKINPNVTGTYRCRTSDVNQIVNDMIENPNITWGDVLNVEQVICLQWVFSHLEAELNDSDDPALLWVSSDDVFVEMIKIDGTFVVTVDAENQEVKIDFEATEEGTENV